MTRDLALELDGPLVALDDPADGASPAWLVELERAVERAVEAAGEVEPGADGVLLRIVARRRAVEVLEPDDSRSHRMTQALEGRSGD